MALAEELISRDVHRDVEFLPGVFDDLGGGILEGAVFVIERAGSVDDLIARFGQPYVDVTVACLGRNVARDGERDGEAFDVFAAAGAFAVSYLP